MKQSEHALICGKQHCLELFFQALTASIVFTGTVVILNNVPSVRTFLINSLSFVGGSGRRRKRSETPLDHHRHNRVGRAPNLNSVFFVYQSEEGK